MQHYTCSLTIASKHSALPRVLAVLLLGLTATYALAEYQPLSLSVSENYQHDSNVFRQPDNGFVSADWISNTGLGLKMDKPYGRQEYLVNVSAGHNQYRRNAQLNNNYYDANLGLNSEIGSNLRASLTADSAQSIASFNNGTTFSTQKNPLHTNSLGLQLQYGLYGRMSVYGGVNYSKQKYDISSLTYPDSRLTTSNIGLQYMPSGAMSLGLGLRRGTGANSYSGGSSGTNDNIRRNDIDLTANWQLTGLSTVNARLSTTHESHSDIGLADFKGLTWSVGWNYTPTGKLTLNTYLQRDTGNGNAPDLYRGSGQESLKFGNVIATGSIATNQLTNQVTNTIGTNLSWQVTAKVALSGNLSFGQYKNNLTATNSGDLVNAGIVNANDPRSSSSHYTALGLSGTYNPLRKLSLSCGVQKLHRTADNIYTLGYKATELNCLGSYTLGGL